MSKCLSDRKESECVSTDGSQGPMDQTAEADTEEGMSDRRNAGRLLKSLSKMCSYGAQVTGYFCYVHLYASVSYIFSLFTASEFFTRP